MVVARGRGFCGGSPDCQHAFGGFGVIEGDKGELVFEGDFEDFSLDHAMDPSGLDLAGASAGSGNYPGPSVVQPSVGGGPNVTPLRGRGIGFPANTEGSSGANVAVPERDRPLLRPVGFVTGENLKTVSEKGPDGSRRGIGLPVNTHNTGGFSRANVSLAGLQRDRPFLRPVDFIPGKNQSTLFEQVGDVSHPPGGKDMSIEEHVPPLEESAMEVDTIIYDPPHPRSSPPYTPSSPHTVLPNQSVVPTMPAQSERPDSGPAPVKPHDSTTSKVSSTVSGPRSLEALQPQTQRKHDSRKAKELAKEERTRARRRAQRQAMLASELNDLHDDALANADSREFKRRRVEASHGIEDLQHGVNDVEFDTEVPNIAQFPEFARGAPGLSGREPVAIADIDAKMREADATEEQNDASDIEGTRRSADDGLDDSFEGGFQARLHKVRERAREGGIENSHTLQGLEALLDKNGLSHGRIHKARLKYLKSRVKRKLTRALGRVEAAQGYPTRSGDKKKRIVKDHSGDTKKSIVEVHDDALANGDSREFKRRRVEASHGIEDLQNGVNDMEFDTEVPNIAQFPEFARGVPGLSGREPVATADIDAKMEEEDATEEQNDASDIEDTRKGADDGLNSESSDEDSFEGDFQARLRKVRERARERGIENSPTLQALETLLDENGLLHGRNHKARLKSLESRVKRKLTRALGRVEAAQGYSTQSGDKKKRTFEDHRADMMALEQQIRTFLQDLELKTLVLPPKGKEWRKRACLMTSAFNLKFQGLSQEGDRPMTLMKTKKKPGIKVDEDIVSWVVDNASNEKGLRKPSSSIRHRDGDEVEADPTADYTAEVVTLEQQIRTFLQDLELKSLVLPEKDKAWRKRAHLLAGAFNLKSQSQGREGNKSMTLKKTKRKPGIDVDERMVSWVVNNASNDKALAKPPLSIRHRDKEKKARRIKPRDGDEVGKMAPRISETNVGFKLLQQMGWEDGNRVGGEAGGLVDPVTVVIKTSKRGLGALS